MRIDCKHCEGLGYLEKEDGPSIWIMHDNHTFTKIEKDWDLAKTINVVTKAYTYDAGSMLAVREYSDGPQVKQFLYHGNYDDKENALAGAISMIIKVKEWQEKTYKVADGQVQGRVR